MSLTTKQCQRIIMHECIRKRVLSCENVKYLFNNSECDVLSLSESGRVTEYEVKTSRSDFKKDASKTRIRHYENAHSATKEKRSNKSAFKNTPNYFYYTCPKGMILEHEVPEWAGLLHLSLSEQGEPIIEVIKKSVTLHSFVHDRLNIVEKFCRVLGERSIYGVCKMSFDRSHKHKESWKI